MKDQPGYYAILTADVRYSKKINFRQKILYAELTALSNKYGYCWPSNNYFAKLYDVASETISRDIAKLSDEGFILVEIDRKAGNRRIIRPVKQRFDGKINTPIDHTLNTPIDHTLKHNNINTNNSIDISEIKQLIVRYFIDKVDGAYDVIPEASLYDNLKTIIDKGYTVEQIKKLIDHKAAQFHRREIDTRAFRLSWLFKPVNFFEQYSIMERPAQPKQRNKSVTNNGAKVTTDSKKWDDVNSL